MLSKEKGAVLTSAWEENEESGICPARLSAGLEPALLPSSGMCSAGMSVPV